MNEGFPVIMGVSVPVVRWISARCQTLRYGVYLQYSQYRKLLRSYDLEDRNHVSIHAIPVKLSQLFLFTGYLKRFCQRLSSSLPTELNVPSC